MDSLLNSAMETFDALPLGPMELVVLAAVITVSLCYLFSKGNAPPSQETATASRSINSTNVGKQQRGIDTNDSTPPTADRDMAEQVHMHSTNNSDPTTDTPPSSSPDDDYDEQEDKCVPDFLSDASSTTTDSDTTAVGTTEQLPTKEHVMMDDNADLLDDQTTRNMDVMPTKHANNNTDDDTSTVSGNIKTTQPVEHDKQEESDDKMTCTQNDTNDNNNNNDTPTTGGGALSLGVDEPMAVCSSSSTDTQQTALQSVTENLDGAETDGSLDMNVDVCNRAVIPDCGATTTMAAEVGEKIDQSLLDTTEENVDDMVETMIKDKGKALFQEESVSQRLHDDDDDGATTADNESATTTVQQITIADPIPEDSHDATTVPDVENSGDAADPCDHHDLNTAAASTTTTTTTTTTMPDANEGVPMMTTTTRSVLIGLDLGKAVTQSMVAEGDDGDKDGNSANLEEDEHVIEKAVVISPTVEEVPVAHPNENQLENKVETATQQPTLSSDQGKRHDDTMMSIGQQQQQQGVMEDSNKTTTSATEDICLPLTVNTCIVDDLSATATSVPPAKYEMSPFSASTMYHPNPTNKPKQDMSRIERIGQQRQPYIPLYKSRCTFWPGCTNNHCKYYHPFIECRNGSACEFGKKCVFLHPKDYNDYQKHASRKTKNKSPNGKQQEPAARFEDLPKTQQVS